jgi:RND family efflux transporter MFP subunit
LVKSHLRSPQQRVNQQSDSQQRAPETQSDSSRSGSRFRFAGRVVLPVLFLIAGLASYVFFSKQPPQVAEPSPKPRPLEVRVEELKRKDFQVRVASHGLIQAHSQVNLTAQVGGRVQTIRSGFDVGALFEKDEVLLELDPVDFEEALANAKAQLAQMEFNLEQERIRAEQARLNWEDLGYEDEPSEMVLRIPHVKLAESQLERAKEQLVSAQRNLERTKVRAPFDGRVLSRSAGLGETIGAGSALGIIFATDYSEVRLPVSTRFLADVSLPEDISDPPVEIVLKDGLTERADVAWPAKILRTEGALDASTLELFAVARVDDPFGLETDRVPLRIGQPVATAIPGRTLPDVFVIPREAVADLNRIRLVDPEELTLRSAVISQLWADDDFLVFNDPSIEDGTLLVLDRLMYAPDGGKVEIVDDGTLSEEESPLNNEKMPEGDSQK